MSETKEVDAAMSALQREYIREAPERLAELRKDLGAFRVGEADALESLRQRFHRLAGSGGSYGFPMVTEISRAMELWIDETPAPTPQEADRFEEALNDLKTAFDSASTELGIPQYTGKVPGFGWRSTLIMKPSPLRTELSRMLGEIGYVVNEYEDDVDPWSVAHTDRPDLVVISTEIGSDPLALARYWSASTSTRPRAVVMADMADRYDKLHTAAAGIDSVFGLSDLPRGLVNYARALAQIGSPPAKVMVVEDDPAQAQIVAASLENINAQTSICGSAEVAYEALLNNTPDLVLLDVDLPGTDGYALARLMRQDPRLALVPIVFMTARTTIADQMDGLRAGGDDFLSKPVDPGHLLQLVLTRTERGRRLRELVHRDGLTGVLNHATLMAELEHAIAYASRHGEPLCFLMLDLDHFKRVNDTYGHLVGDQLLRHAANLFRKGVRDSDLLGRYGGEEFGIILRKCPPANGLRIAEKLRMILEERPMTTQGGPEIAIRVSIGVASFPGSGSSSSEVAASADLALYRAKSNGRNRIEMG